ncbi:IS66 family transposase [Singulisphaera sp. PoT]|uniref:IS66 family transposase n=1 Tax=Singulisphaera sp. PoT TaxID=3411797 RepID=UPI003BF48BAF
MPTLITRHVIESYLNCGYKGHLKLGGEQGTPSEYEALLASSSQTLRAEALSRLMARFGEGNADSGAAITPATLKRGMPLLVDAVLRDDDLSLDFDGLRMADGPSQIGGHHYVPILHHEGSRAGHRQKQLLAMYGLALGKVQGKQPAFGLLVHGPDSRLMKVRLDSKLYRKAELILGEMRQLRAGGEAPRLTLNGHCPLCEFRQRCRAHALKEDDISLLGAVGAKELQRYNRKGIFTLTQLSCTFRPRKRGKRVKRPGAARYSSLQALAIREKRTHVYGVPDLPRKPVQVFFDAEGNTDGSFAYLLGVLVAEGGSLKPYAFWADGPDQEEQSFNSFLDLLAGYEDLALFHYGSYEKAILRRMRGAVKRKKLVDRIASNAVNVLSEIHAKVYFATFSNGLKEVGRHLGCTWSEENASGLQSLVWRARWEQTQEPGWKEKLLAYNAEDCAALKRVAEYVQAIGEAARHRGEVGGNTPPESCSVTWADDVVAPSSRREWGQNFVLDDFELVNRCAYFDYQREKVFLRTSRAVEKAGARHRERRKARRLRPDRKVEIRSRKCPFCKGDRITRFDDRMHVKVAYDLKFSSGGIRRQVIHYTAALHQCEGCKKQFLPKRYKRRDKHLHGLKSWAMYQHIVHRVSFQHLETMFEDCFGLRVGLQELFMMKALMANRYRTAWKRILARIVRGAVAHADETHVNLQRGKGYVWVLTNMEDVAYFYRPSREADYLQRLLGDFKGVLVSDFYSGYDSLPCPQQKCLVHLIRDLNHDLKNNPYDEQFKALAAEFGALLRSIVATIDKYGLKKRHLRKHKADAARFFRDLAARVYRSELAEGYQKRLAKNEEKLFTFLDYDGVPWNNNNAEHAIKAFAYYRRVSDGKMRAQGVSDYLVLLSVYQACKYRGVSFLKFLLSGERDVETFCGRGRKAKRPARVEVYPKGFPRQYRRKTEGESAQRPSGKSES